MSDLLLRWLKTVGRWIGLMLMIPLAAFLFLLTPAGLKLGLFMFSQWAPGELHYQQVTGSILGPLTIKQLSYRYQDQQISLRQLSLQWHPAALLIGKLFIEKMSIDQLKIDTPAAPAPAFSLGELKSVLQKIRPQLTALELPLNVQINQASVNNLIWRQQPGEPALQVTGVQMHGVITASTLKINVQGSVQKPYAIQTNLSIDGAPQHYHFALTAFNPVTHWLVNGQVNPHEVQLDTEKALVFGGELTVHLLWKWEAPMSWQLALSGRHLDLGALQPDWPHPLDITLDSAGSLGEDHPHFSWNAVLQTPQTRVATQGSHDQQWNIQWNIKIRQLAELLPFCSGSIDSSGELHGSLTQPQTKGSLSASRLRWQDYRADKITAQWDIDGRSVQNSFFQIAAEQVFSRALQLQKIQLAGKGKWDKHELNAAINGYHTDVQLALAGGVKSDHWLGSLQTFSITTPYAGAWKLSRPTALDISPQGVQVTALCLQSAYQSQLCLRGEWRGEDDAWKIALTSRLTFQQIAALAPEALSINLPLDLHLTAEGIGKEITQAQLTGSTPTGNVRYSGPQVIETQVNNVQLIAKLDKTGLTADLHVTLANNNLLSATLALPKATSTRLFDKDQVIQGNISIELNDLTPIEALIPDTLNPQGKFQAHFTVGGTLGKPLVSGNADIAGGDIKIPGLNIQLNQINLALQAEGSTLNYTVTATSANQPLRLTGQTRLNEKGFPTELTLTGDTVLLADTPVYTVYVSPHIQVALQGRAIHITGAVDIPKAILHQLELRQETTLPEDEIVYIGEHPAAKATPWDISMELTINIGKEVYIDSPGQLKGKLSGSITLISQPKQVMLGLGRIDISDGVYEVFGRKLTITPGSGIIYRRNPLTNPALSIQAITRVIVTDVVSQQQLGTNEITVGMNIGGTSSSPQVTLFSSAGNLSQADMLSFLLLGTSSAGISPTNMNLMLQALNSLPLTKKGAGGVQSLTNQVKQGLGLTELGVESEATYGPSGEALPTTTPTSYFVVGKRLTSRIYLRYKYDPFSSLNLFQLSYLFSKNWSLQLETDGSNQSGADVLYTIQTGTPKSADKTPAK